MSYAVNELRLPFDPQPASAAQRTGSKGTRKAISSGFNIFLLFGAAIDRFVSRIQEACLVTGLAAVSVIRTGAGALKTRAARSFMRSPAGRKVEQLQQSIAEVQRQLPEDTWGKIMWLWDRPPVQRLRLTVSMFNLSFRLPALLALVATQVGLLASQVSLPMLAPLLLGTGMLLRSIKTNASFLFPRIGLLVVMLWLLWFANSVVQNTTAYLRKQGAIDNRLAGGIITVSEVSTLLVAAVVLLSMLGVNVSALLLPAGIAVAVAAKDLAHNFLAGFFLFVVQPFKLGDRLAVASSSPGVGMGMGGSGGWFEGVCEKVDLRYTIVRQGRRRLMVPNSAFLTREFMVLDDGPVGEAPPPMPGAGEEQYTQHAQQFLTNDHRHVWQYVQGPPVHQELAVPRPGVPVSGAPHDDRPAPSEHGNGSPDGGAPPTPDTRTEPGPALGGLATGVAPGPGPQAQQPQPVAMYGGPYSSGPVPGPQGYYQTNAAPMTTYNAYGQPMIGMPSPGATHGHWQAGGGAFMHSGGMAPNGMPLGGLRSHPLGPDDSFQAGSTPGSPR